MSWNFDGDCIESADCFRQDSHFYYINAANAWSWEIFPSSEIFFDFFLQRLEVLIIQIFYFLSWIHTKVFYIICDYCEGCCFPNFFLSLLSFVYRKVTDLFELILYLPTALKLFIKFRSSLVEFFRSLICAIISSSNSDRNCMVLVQWQAGRSME